LGIKEVEIKKIFSFLRINENWDTICTKNRKPYQKVLFSVLLCHKLYASHLWQSKLEPEVVGLLRWGVPNLCLTLERPSTICGLFFKKRWQRRRWIG
jgi:hypothetical protein